MVSYSKADIMVCCIAREIKNGDFIVQGIATPLVSAGYILANFTHAPDLLLLYVVGNTLSRSSGPISFTNYEQLTIGKSLKKISFADISCEILPTLTPKEFFRPAQVDRWGNFNNVVIGEYNSPSIRLPGGAGISDVTTFYPEFYLYIPRHNNRVFVETIDFLSGIGRYSEKNCSKQNWRENHKGLDKIITDLCVMGFEKDEMTVLSLHPGVELKEVEDKTGFKLRTSDRIKETLPPSEKELSLLRGKIDPLGTRDLELLSGQERLQRIKEILEEEKKLSVFYNLP